MVDGRTLFAKAFSDMKDVATTRDAQKAFLAVSDEDEPLLPKAIAWVDESILVSEKAEGSPLRQILKDVVEGKRDSEEVYEAFAALGTTLGQIHERTKRDFTEQDLNSEHRFDAKLIREDLDNENIRELLHLSPELIEKVKEAVVDIALPGHVSLNHGDAHLDQFFKAPNSSHVMIVDYDKLYYDDPMSDLSRSVSSLRAWSWKLDVPLDLENKCLNSLINGYREECKESTLTDDLELDRMKIIAYELRHYLLLLRWGQDVIQKVESLVKKDYSNSRDFFVAYAHEEINDMQLQQYGFSEDEKHRINEISFAIIETEDVARYLESFQTA